MFTDDSTTQEYFGRDGFIPDYWYTIETVLHVSFFVQTPIGFVSNILAAVTATQLIAKGELTQSAATHIQVRSMSLSFTKTEYQGLKFFIFWIFKFSHKCFGACNLDVPKYRWENLQVQKFRRFKPWYKLDTDSSDTAPTPP